MKKKRIEPKDDESQTETQDDEQIIENPLDDPYPPCIYGPPSDYQLRPSFSQRLKKFISGSSGEEE